MAPEDRDFTELMRKQAESLLHSVYNVEEEKHVSFNNYHAAAGWVDVSEQVIAASPDLVSVVNEAGSYYDGMAHPNRDDGTLFIWSRRLHRQLAQDDVFAIPPDRALRRLALSRFDNLENLQSSDFPDGLPISWNGASIGPDGITWTFYPYQLGDYVSSGRTMIPWSSLKPYLRKDLPFDIDAIRAAPG